MGNLFRNYYDIAAMIIFGIGFGLLLLNKNMMKKLVGFDMMDSATFIFLTAKGFVGGQRVAPIIENGITSYSHYISPVPTGLVLTGIVVGVSVSAFALALIYRLYRVYHTMDLDLIMKMRRQAERSEQSDAK